MVQSIGTAKLVIQLKVVKCQPNIPVPLSACTDIRYNKYVSTLERLIMKQSTTPPPPSERKGLMTMTPPPSERIMTQATPPPSGRAGQVSMPFSRPGLVPSPSHGLVEYINKEWILSA